MLPKDQFLEVVDRVPLLCLDLLLTDPDGRVLLGWRENEPARHRWFVPGGSVMKNERIEDAFARVTEGELGFVPEFGKARFRGVHQHFFAEGENFARDPEISTHCIVLAYEIAWSGEPAVVIDEQHGELRWFSPETLLGADDVHDLTKDYFRRPESLGLGHPPR